jgi:hypothetical protein
MKTHLTWLLFLARTALASIGLVDLDVDSFEIRFAAVIYESKVDPPVFSLGVCVDPLEKFGRDCLTDPFRTEITSVAFFTALENQIGLGGRKKLSADLAYRERRLEWLRRQFTKQVEDGRLDDATKERSTLLLLKMAKRLTPLNDAIAQYDGKIRTRDRLRTLLEEDRATALAEPSETIVRQIDPAAYDAALAPFSPWLEKNICTCSLREAELVIAHANQILAQRPREGDESLTADRCRAGNWKLAPGAISFASMLDKVCRGYLRILSP